MFNAYRVQRGDKNTNEEIKGVLAGEFLQSNGAPDGRCRFRADDDSLVVLCFFTNGRKSKGPQLKWFTSKGLIEMRSKTWIVNGHQVCTLSVIEKNKPGRTGYFVDKKLTKSFPYIQNENFDWLHEAFRYRSECSPVKFDGSFFGAYNQNDNLERLGIHIHPKGIIDICD